MTTLIDYSNIQSLPEVWSIVAQRFPNIIALHDPHSKPEVILTYRELYQQIQQFAAALQALGVTETENVALFADNSPRWFIADQGSMAAGAANAVRSAQADAEELAYILADSDSQTLIVENNQTLGKLLAKIPELPLKLIVLLTDEDPATGAISVQTLNFKQLMAIGAENTLKPITKGENDLATLIYTSGTTGQPKGVMLSHGNLLHQVRNLNAIFQPDPGDRVLSILPSWHSYERSCEYFSLAQGCTQIYTSIRTFKQDLKQFSPQLMVGVPRLWESLYEGIQKQFSQQLAKKQKLVQFFLEKSEKYVIAKRIADNLSLDHLHASPRERLKARIQSLLLYPLHAIGDKLVYNKIRQAVGNKVKIFVSGGGSLARHLDTFYEIAGIPILVGYGLTETSPVATVRRIDHNLRGSAGRPVFQTEICIVDLHSKEVLPTEKHGLVLIRGPQVMQGYYKKPEATEKAISPDGWFDSGDIGWLTAAGDLVLTGRAKDTIVLSNGENIEPQPIEDACLRSPFISQIMLVGQDQKALGALIVPNLDILANWAQEQKLSLNLPDLHSDRSTILSSDLYSKKVLDLYQQELKREVRNRPSYRADDQIKTFELILEPFSLENGMMTQTLKIKRPVVTQRYRDMINEMFAK
ncbi:long-chain fatty acid--CoA ligase [Microcystis aeruginosa CS-564/01]|uniref:long-chain fatty acid--CoA ligase n=1 Tax=Microcystis aeruginosa TaxID=1126 RepID=UPI002330730A|nr:long-chain fatty acid--CoA ligase [Microcystis aeruginosa]MDB9427068.1 long-chain fatty acid--CoA ligase [Microcystis aeruginosa CS-564/01]